MIGAGWDAMLDLTNMIKRFLALPLLLVGSSGLCGELQLGNGARIPGELKRIEATKVVWSAELIGDISINKSDVVAMHTGTRSDLETAAGEVLRDCGLSSSEGRAELECTGQPAMTTTLALLQPTTPLQEGTGKITTSMTVERGESHKDELELDARSSWRRLQRRHVLDASIDYEERHGERSDDEASLDYQLDLLRRNGWFWFSLVDYNRDRFDTIQESEGIATGLGRDLNLAGNLKLRLQAGPGIVHLDIDGEGRLYKEVGDLKWSTTWDTGLWKLQLFHSAEFIWVLDDRGIYRLESKTGLTLPLIDGLVAELRLDYDHSSAPSTRLENSDTEAVLALGYRW
jgi:putative salt-induced outer membrane protein YdiY